MSVLGLVSESRSTGGGRGAESSNTRTTQKSLFSQNSIFKRQAHNLEATFTKLCSTLDFIVVKLLLKLAKTYLAAQSPCEYPLCRAESRWVYFNS